MSILLALLPTAILLPFLLFALVAVYACDTVIHTLATKPNQTLAAFCFSVANALSVVESFLKSSGSTVD